MSGRVERGVAESLTVILQREVMEKEIFLCSSEIEEGEINKSACLEESFLVVGERRGRRKVRRKGGGEIRPSLPLP